MGQKTHPYGFRLVYNKSWLSRWYAEGDYKEVLQKDLELRQMLKGRLAHAAVSEIEIERAADRLRVTIYTARPGVVIGRKGVEVDRLRDDLTKMVGHPVQVNIQEVQRPELDAQLVAESIAGQLERRVAFRRAMRKAMESAFRFGAKGVKVMVAGRLGGREIARTEWYQEGRLPLHTLKADIDFGLAEARTTYGVIGCKVWIYRGELQREKVQRLAV
ncbi:MAG: 30S ribosomal protein S3 [Thermoanaerobaculia bacterium]